MAELLRVPTDNAVQYTLDGQLAQGGTSSLTLNQDITDIVRAPGICVIDRIDANGEVTPAKREYIKFTGASGSTLNGLTRAQGGSSDQVHPVGAIVEFIPDVEWANALHEVITEEHTEGGAHKDDIIGAPQLKSNAVETAKIADGAVTADKLAASLLTGWLDADESWEYASADAPTFVITVPSDATTKYSPGMRIRLSQSTGGTKYFIITAVSSTTLTVYGGTDYTLNNEAISSPFYSTQKAPFGFPLSAAKWSVRVTNTSSASQTASDGVWYNLGTFSAVMPIGIWRAKYSVSVYYTGTGDKKTTLSTANNSESDIDMTAYSGGAGASAQHSKEKVITAAAKTTYYLNTTKSGGSGDVHNFGARATSVIEFISVYL
jgi:hypothetical protein